MQHNAFVSVCKGTENGLTTISYTVYFSFAASAIEQKNVLKYDIGLMNDDCVHISGRKPYIMIRK